MMKIFKKRIIDIPDKIDPTINLLKLIAIVAMTIDHIGYFFFPGVIELRLVGRLAAPIFAYLIVAGLKHTKSLQQYFLRLFILAIISQVVFYLTTSQVMPNIIFNFLGVIALVRGPIWLKLALIPIYVLVDIEGGWMILAIGAIYHYCKRPFLQPFLVLIAVALYCISGIWLSSGSVFYAIQLGAGVSGFVIMAINNWKFCLKNSRFLMMFWPRYFFYAYYPLNWLILYTVKFLLG